MGNSTWDPNLYTRTYSSNQAFTKQTRAQTFAQTGIHPDLDPKNFTIRESRDSDANPNSTPIIVGLDETGSMGEIPEKLIKGKLGTFMQELLDRKPVTDPHLMFLGIGDELVDYSPIQATQFEAGVDPIVKQLGQIYLEGNGGGNGTEGYSLAWYFAATRTVTDSMLKRNQKGFLFTIGDENVTRGLSRNTIKNRFGDTVERDFSAQELLQMASRNWEVYHLFIDHHSGLRFSINGWRQLMGERVIRVTDYEMVAEVMISIMQANAGVDKQTIMNSWSGKTSVVVADAIRDLTVNRKNTGVVTL